MIEMSFCMVIFLRTRIYTIYPLPQSLPSLLYLLMDPEVHQKFGTRQTRRLAHRFIEESQPSFLHIDLVTCGRMKKKPCFQEERRCTSHNICRSRIRDVADSRNRLDRKALRIPESGYTQTVETFRWKRDKVIN